MPNPFNACLNAGWRVGFTGVSDEHSGTFGQQHKGRGGLWVQDLTRASVRSALETRRTFATMEPGLRLDATADGVPMGSVMGAPGGVLEIAVDIARGDDWVGKTLWAELVGPGTDGPRLLEARPITVPADDQPPVKFMVYPDGVAWLFLRIIDPDRPRHPLAQAPFEAHGGACAYASPWFFELG